MNPRWLRRTAVATILVVALAGVTAVSVRAVQIGVGGQLPAGQTIDDDYITSGENALIEGTVNGNLIVSGVKVTLNGTVHGDVIVNAQNIVVGPAAVIDGNVFASGAVVRIGGTVKGSVFAAMASIVMDPTASIGGNAYLASYSVRYEKGSRVGRDAVSASYQLVLNGDVTRDVKAGAGAVEIGGTIGGDALLDMGDTASDENAPDTGFVPMLRMFGDIPDPLQLGLRIAPEAVIKGKLSYSAANPMTTGIQSQPAGGIVYLTPVPQPEPEQRLPVAGAAGAAGAAGIVLAFIAWLWETARTIITLLVLGLLAVRFIPVLVGRATDLAHSKPLLAAWQGFLVIVIGWAAVVAAAIAVISLGIFTAVLTLGGLSGSVFSIGFSALGLAGSVFSLLIGYGSKLVIARMAGTFVMDMHGASARGKDYWAMVIGVLIYGILAAIPFIGWLIALGATLVGMGGMWFAYRELRPGTGKAA